jgi:hypothetical protein
MAEVVLSSDDLTVLGGPSTVQVDLNIGPAGNRGVFVMYGVGDPNTPGTNFIDTPQIFDLYVLTNPASSDYLQIFQYLNQDGVVQWVPAIKLSQNFYATTRALDFVNGECSITFNAFELGLFEERLNLPTYVGTAASLNIQATVGNFDFVSYLAPGLGLPLEHNPTALSILVNDLFLDVDSELKFTVSLKAAEFDGTSWANVDGKKIIVHFYMQVTDPTFVAAALAEAGGS